MKNKIFDFFKTIWGKNKIEISLFLGVIVVLPFFMIYPPANGDPYTYARSLSSFDAPVIHFGYYVIGAILHFLMGIFGAGPLLTLGYFSVWASAICVVCMYLLTLDFTGDRWQSLIAALILLFSGTFMVFSLHGEVYVPQLAFVMLAAILIIRGRYLAAGFLEVIACSITPTSLLALFPLGCLVVQKKAGKNGLLKFLLPFLALAVLLLFKTEKVIEVFSAAVFAPELFVEQFTFFKVSGYVFFELAKIYGASFNMIFLFALWGVVILLKENRKVLICFGCWFLPFLLYIFNLGLLSGDHLIITFIPVSFFASVGCIEVFKKMEQKKVIISVVLILYLVISWNMGVSSEKRRALEIQRVVLELDKIYEPRAIMFSEYNFGVCYWYSVNEKENIFILSGRPNMLIRDSRYTDEQVMNRLKESFWLNFSSNMIDFLKLIKNKKSILENRVIYYVEKKSWPESFKQKLSQGLKNTDIVDDRSNRLKMKKIWEKMFNKKIEFKKIVDSPLCPVYRIVEETMDARRNDGD
ncbi:MAG: hypothetical protein ABII88_06680 [Candidatus Omnitrophota bacterium]